MMDRHHCKVWFCSHCQRWHCECDGTPNCHWLDYHEMTHASAMEAVRKHITDMHTAWTTKW